ncbi:uncharacterized protein ACOB8E_019664 isoform 1-T1 [Sarcophilus harrisii]
MWEQAGAEATSESSGGSRGHLVQAPLFRDMEEHSTGRGGQPRGGARALPPCQAFPRRHHLVREAGPLYPSPGQKKGPGALEALKVKEPKVSPREEEEPLGAGEELEKEAKHKQPPSDSLPGLVHFISNDGVHSTARLVRGTMVAAAARMGVEASGEAVAKNEEEPEGEEESGGTGSGQGLMEDKRFLCVACGKHFKRAWELFSHEVVHNSARPFHCELCDAAFKRHSDFKSHALVHSEERPHTCEACGKGFKRASNLQMLSETSRSSSYIAPQGLNSFSRKCHSSHFSPLFSQHTHCFLFFFPRIHGEGLIPHPLFTKVPFPVTRFRRPPPRTVTFVFLCPPYTLSREAPNSNIKAHPHSPHLLGRGTS